MDKLTEKQRNQLVSFMEKNEEFAKGQITDLSVQGKQNFSDKWNNLVLTLNNLGNPRKSKSWKDVSFKK